MNFVKTVGIQAIRLLTVFIFSKVDLEVDTIQKTRGKFLVVRLTIAGNVILHREIEISNGKKTEIQEVIKPLKKTKINES